MHIRRAVMLPFIILAAVIIGGLLYLFGDMDLNPSPPQAGDNGVIRTANPATSDRIIAQGQDALGMSERVNYHIKSQDQLEQLWALVFPAGKGSVPDIDFSEYELLAAFDGSHSTDGYSIEVGSIEEKDGIRWAVIRHSEPGEVCTPAIGQTSPFIMVRIPKSELPLEHTDETVTDQCA